MKTIRSSVSCYCPQCGQSQRLVGLIFPADESIAIYYCDCCFYYFLTHLNCPQVQTIDRETAIKWSQQKQSDSYNHSNGYPHDVGYELIPVIINVCDSTQDWQKNPFKLIHTGTHCSECLRLFNQDEASNRRSYVLE